MAASINDKLRKTYNAANPNVALVTVTRASLGTTLTCDNLTGWPTDTAVDFSTYKKNSSGAVIAGTQIDWKGIVSGSTIGTLTRITGAADTGSAIGDVVEMNPTASWANDLVTNVLTHAKQDGTLKDSIVTTTALADSSVTTSKILDSAVSSSKLATGASSATVATSQTTSSTSYADLATVGPAATVTVGANGLAFVTVGCSAGHGSTDLPTSMSFAISGASTVAAGTWGALVQRLTTATAQGSSSWSVLVTGLTPGSTTFTAKYRVSAGTGTFVERYISVIPL